MASLTSSGSAANNEPVRTVAAANRSNRVGHLSLPPMLTQPPPIEFELELKWISRQEMIFRERGILRQRRHGGEFGEDTASGDHKAASKRRRRKSRLATRFTIRSEEHTSELQS